MRSANASLEEHGFACVPRVVPEELCKELGVAFAVDEAAGRRLLLREPLIATVVQHLRTSSPASGVLSANAVAVQCSLFSKSDASNWLVPPHQDLSIPVAERVPGAECGGWSEKEGLLFVQPPVDVLSQLVAIRIQLDSPSRDSGELLVAPGTHRVGRIPASKVGGVASISSMHVCVVPRAGALVMRPLLVHASRKAAKGTVRRVLHLLFGPPVLSHGLRWAHAI
jgi:hypothetical protein